MDGLHDITVSAEEAGRRLDQMLAARIAEVSRSRLAALVREGRVTVGGRTIRDPDYRVNAQEAVQVSFPAPEPATPRAEAIPLVILYEDADIIVIDKPAGLVVHPAPGHGGGTLVNALIAHCGDSLSGIGGVKRPGIVHRLDKDTSGVMIAAKNDRAHRSLSRQFADHGRTGALHRSYCALVWGDPGRTSGTVDAPLDRSPHARDKQAVRQGGREAITHWERLASYRSGADTARRTEPVASLIRCTLETGRTHQIRVHMAHIGHPLLGDAVYGSGFLTKTRLLPPAAQVALTALGRQALHAASLTIEHPRSKEVMTFSAPPPADFAALQAALEATE